jgi:hypothetical protein
VKTLRTTLFTAIVCLIFIFAPLTYGYGQSELEIISNPSVNQVTIDGMWTTQDEWVDAAEIASQDAVLSVKDNGEYVYVLLDFLADEKLEPGDFAGMTIDVSNDKADNPQLDDFSISLVHSPRPKPTIWIFQGNSTQWNLIYRADLEVEDPLKIIGESTNITANDPYSNSSHVIYEFAIPRKTIGNASEIGFSAFFEDKEVEVTIPEDADYHPASWSTLKLATETEEIATPTESPTAPTPTTTEQLPTPTETLTSPQPTTQPQSSIGARERAILVMIFTIIIIGALLIRGRKQPKKKKVK